MAISILILCIVSMISFNSVASENSPSLVSDSPRLLDFGFSRLIDDLVSANDNSAIYHSKLAIFAEVKNQSRTRDGTDVFIKETIRHWMLYDRGFGLADSYYLGVHDVDVLYELLDLYSWNENLSMEKLKCLAIRLTSFPEESINGLMFKLHDGNLMKSLIENMNIEEIFPARSEEASINDCPIRKRSQQYGIYEIYHELVIFIAKIYTMKIHATHLRRGIYIRYDHEIADKRNEYEKTIRSFQETALSAIANASRDIRSCELFIYEKEQKYIELKWLFNTIVTNEAYLNKDASCWKKCADYQDTKFYQYAPQPLDKLNICHGRIYNCFQQTVDSYCPSKKNHSRFEGLLPSKMGRTSCQQKYDISNKVSNGAFDKCEQCICYCDDYDRNDTVRTFSLRAVESDTSENRVITGLQFVERNQMIYLRIQEGKLKPHGIIEKSTIKWQPVHEFDHKSSSASPDDFFTITYGKKFVNLDTLVAPAGQVLTGIKLSAQGSHLALEIKTHAFNPTTGLLGNGSHFVTGKNNIPRQEIMMTAPDDPIHMNQTVIDTRENTYVTFRMTDLGKDAAQTAIPFIDAQPVVSTPSVPFSGAGIYYAGQTGYGGFIGLKAVAYNLSEFIGN